MTTITMSTITATTFRWVPPIVQGLVRDLRVRWALEEAGLQYQTKLIDPEDQQSVAYLSMQPFGQVPVYEEDGFVLFESGAIVLHIAERCEALMPNEPHARARTKTWMFAALNSVEQFVQMLAEIDLFAGGQEWAKLRRPTVLAATTARLSTLTQWLEGREYLEGRFTAADLLMTTVLRILRHTDLVSGFPALRDYQRRCEARPAFQKALGDHMASFAANAPT
jgi:glutathione S-transferase